MNSAQIKSQIVLIRTADWLLVAVFVGYLVYAYLHSFNLNFIVTIAVVGLIVIHQFGQWSINRVAFLQHSLKRKETTPHVR